MVNDADEPMCVVMIVAMRIAWQRVYCDQVMLTPNHDDNNRMASDSGQAAKVNCQIDRSTSVAPFVVVPSQDFDRFVA
jgi:hypothetical protein